MEAIYQLAGKPLTREARKSMASFMESHPRGKHGRILYDLADFGMDPSERRRALEFYVDRFGVEIEGS